MLFCEDGPIIDTGVIDQTSNEGDTIFFTCQVSGTPVPDINWYFNGAPVKKANSMKFMISEIKFNPSAKNSTLTIMHVELSDIGTYTCNATNLVSSSTSSGTLNINGKHIDKICMKSILFFLLHSYRLCIGIATQGRGRGQGVCSPPGNDWHMPL